MRLPISPKHDIFDEPDKTVIVDPSVPGGGSGGVNLNTGLLVAWDLDGALTDAGPNGYDLSASGSPTLGTYGGRTGLRTSSGNHAYADAASAPGLNELSEFSVALWLKGAGTANAGAVNNALAWTTAARRWKLNTIDTGSGNIGLRFEGRDSSLGDFLSATTTTVNFQSTTWNHVILTFSNTNKRARIYVNGSLEVDFDFTGYTLQTGSSWGIGLGGDGDGSGSNVEIAADFSRVFFWDHEISADYRTAVYNGGSDLKSSDF